jgi:SAM-dependent methyltransferase
MNCFNCKKIIIYLFDCKDYVTNEKFRIFRCNYCNIDFPVQRPLDVDKYYPKKYRNYNKFIKLLFDLMYTGKANFLNKFNYQNQRKILEIGCGNGLLLEKLKTLGWNVFGTERSETVKNLNKNDLNITDKDISKFEDNEFDMIILNNSFEHIINPFSLEVNFSKKLKSGGILAITVPVSSSIQYKFGKNHWFHLDIPRHLQIFKENYFEKYLKSNGLKLEIIKPIGFFWEFFGWFQTMNNKFFKNQNKFFRSLSDFNNFKKYFFLGFLQFSILLLPTSVLTLYSFVSKKTSIKLFILKKIL